MSHMLHFDGQFQARRWLKALCVTLVVGLLVKLLSGNYRNYRRPCSTSQTTEFIQDLCAAYDNREIAGNMCEGLCHRDQFTFQGCANTNIGKTVAMMQCRDCGCQQRHERHHDDRFAATVVLKSKLNFMHGDWAADHYVHFDAEESTLSMVSSTTNALSGFVTDLSNETDILTYIWRQRFQVDVTGDADREYAKAALQSIISLAIQEEYRAVVNLLSLNASYLPGLYGTCGPAYITEYTPSLTALSYVLHSGKAFGEFASFTFAVVPWLDRARAALQLLNIMQHLDSLDPPVFLCDIQPHNFGVSVDGYVKVLDVDSLHFGRVWPPGFPCNTDADCMATHCFVYCNLTTHTCNQQPVNNHLQKTCRYIFSSRHPALPLGLLRMPPSSIGSELKQLLQECATPVNSGSRTLKSDETIHRKLVALLQSTLS